MGSFFFSKHLKGVDMTSVLMDQNVAHEVPGEIGLVFLKTFEERVLTTAEHRQLVKCFGCPKLGGHGAVFSCHHESGSRCFDGTIPRE